MRVSSKGLLASSDVVIVGGQASKTELRTGRAFGGPQERVLDELLATSGIQPNRTFRTLVLPEVGSRFFAKSQFTSEGQAAVAELQEQLLRWPGKFLLATDDIALQALTSRSGVYDWRGSVVESTLVPGKWVFCSLPVASCLPPQCVWENRWLLQHDFRRFGQHVQRGTYEKPSYQTVIQPTFSEVIEFIAEAAAQPRVTHDIEVCNRQVSCISLAFTPTAGSPIAMSIPFVWDGGGGDVSYFTEREELEIWLRLGKVFSDPAIASLGQNIVFDTSYVFERYGIMTRNLHDTMIAQNIIAPDYPKGLDFITSIWTDLPYYKKEGKTWFKLGGRWENLWQYNATDSLVCELAFPKQLEQLATDGNLETYDRQRSICEPLVYMTAHGIKANRENLGQARRENDQLVAELRTKLHTEAGYELNHNSTPQLKEFFYEKRKYKPYRSRKTGSITVDAMALKRLASTHGDRAASLILEIRKIEKVSGTYLQPTKIDPDGRWRSSFNPAGTRFSRISSSENIDNRGGNTQNFKHSVQQLLFGADDGYAGYAIDLSNAELRIEAYYGNVLKMIECYETGVDVHALMAGRIFDCSWQEALAEDKAKPKILCPLGSGCYTKRFWGKKSNFSLGYDMAQSTFALQCELPRSESDKLFTAYHKLFPEIRSGFHRRVQDELQRTGFVTNLFGRRVRFQGRLDSNLYRDAYSSVPQSTVGDIINERGLKFLNQRCFGDVELLNQVHDEIVFQLPLALGWAAHSQIIGEIVRSLETPLETEGRVFVIPADVTIFRRFKAGRETKTSPSELEASWLLLQE